MTNQNDARTQSFGLCGPDVILGKNLHYTRPSNPRYEGDVYNAQRDTRQHQAFKTRDKTVRELLVALNWKPLELNSEHIHQDVTDDKNRHGKPQHGEYHREPIYKGARFPRGEHAKWNREHDRYENS